MNNKISEKAVWENGITTDESDYTPLTQSIQTPVQSQPQMMFCYNCNQVIPANSAFCPWCQTELFTLCPKCGNKYSSQYPSCNQCGTNKKEYLLAQSLIAIQKKKEQEKKREQERIIAEERRRREAEVEKEKREQEEREKRRRERERELEHAKKMEELDEKRRIKATAEFREAYECMKYLKDQNFKNKFWGVITSIFELIFCIFGGFPFAIINEEVLKWGRGLSIIAVFLPIALIIIWISIPTKKGNVSKRHKSEDLKRRKFYWRKLKYKTISSEMSKSIIYRIITKQNIDWDDLETEVIKAYKFIYCNQHYKDHNYRCGQCGFSANFAKLPSECPLCHAPSICFEKLNYR